ncbi:MAG: TlpA disulfide reductase family protein [Solirubrobacteraceae bacterium]
MKPKRLAAAAAIAAVAVLVIVGLVQLGGNSSGAGSAQTSTISLAQMRAGLAGSPAQLAALHDQADVILPGGLGAVRARIAALRGQPIVINKWASWCEPCRSEFGVFAHVSVEDGRQVAFLGIDSGDSSSSSAAAFLRAHPVSYPSYYDPSGQAGEAITDSGFTPVTVFIDRQGGQYIHQGPYLSVAKLERDVRRYALGA